MRKALGGEALLPWAPQPVAVWFVPERDARFSIVPVVKPASSRAASRGLNSPEEALRRALAARTSVSRAKHARSGLAVRGPIDPTVHAMLLRQLYLSLFETRRFDEALDVARQATSLGVLPDVLHHDAARAAFAAGESEAAVQHLRVASRCGPAGRRAQHLWTLGSTLFLLQRYPESIAALTRAARWATHEKPLYRAHLALVRIAAGETVEELQEVTDSLASAPCGQGYGRFVLGHLAYAAGEWAIAQRYLDAFVRRCTRGRGAMGIALEAELAMARATLAKMAKN
jgi:tetratricopeptide (TPR) repeat protein